MKKEKDQQAVISLLKNRGLIAAGDLAKELGVSRATLARRLSNISPQLAAVGKTRNQHYGLLRAVSDLESELPLFRINLSGEIVPIGKLLILHGGYCVVEPHAQIFQAPPPEVFDMAPQGFMGRAFARSFASELKLPPRLEDWSDDHILRAVARRGEDLAGNLIVGKDSADRWQKLLYSNTKRASFKDLAELALREQPVGSSAGGERPKFSVLLADKHKLVKFAGPLNQPVQRRWSDLLHCEFLANEVLAQSGIICAHSEIWESGNFVFLEVERFDRIGKKGRRPFLSFAAVDGFLFGDRNNWTATAQRLQRSGLLSETDTGKVRLCDTFARLIGDSDRHFYNMGLFPKFSAEEFLLPESYELAPLFDKLPMMFAPIDGRILERVFSVDLPGAELITEWHNAVALAKTFWDRVSKEKSISLGFRQIAKKCLKALS